MLKCGQNDLMEQCLFIYQQFDKEGTVSAALCNQASCSNYRSPILFFTHTLIVCV